MNAHKTRLQNVTAGTTLLDGGSESSSISSGAVTRSWVMGTITVGDGQALELQHRFASTGFSNTELGLPSSFGVAEVYSTVEFLKVG